MQVHATVIRLNLSLDIVINKHFLETTYKII